MVTQPSCGLESQPGPTEVFAIHMLGTHILVGRHQQLEPCGLGGCNQFAVYQPVPTSFLCVHNHVTLHCITERSWSSIVKEDEY